eukprot:m.50396 g.50396  ORF g.50396 m.50396 type:complete len:581 (-) comp13416_c0_seq1:247-1989(-)
MSYIGADLTAKSSKRLMAWCQTQLGDQEELPGRIHCEHVTLQHKPSEEQLFVLPATAAAFKVTGFGLSETGCAVRVESRRLPCANSIPHVTVSCHKSPVYSNTLLAETCKAVDGPWLLAVVGSFQPSEWHLPFLAALEMALSDLECPQVQWSHLQTSAKLVSNGQSWRGLNLRQTKVNFETIARPDFELKVGDKRLNVHSLVLENAFEPPLVEKLLAVCRKLPETLKQQDWVLPDDPETPTQSSSTQRTTSDQSSMEPQRENWQAKATKLVCLLLQHLYSDVFRACERTKASTPWLLALAELSIWIGDTSLAMKYVHTVSASWKTFQEHSSLLETCRVAEPSLLAQLEIRNVDDLEIALKSIAFQDELSAVLDEVVHFPARLPIFQTAEKEVLKVLTELSAPESEQSNEAFVLSSRGQPDDVVAETDDDYTMIQAHHHATMQAVSQQHTSSIKRMAELTGSTLPVGKGLSLRPIFKALADSDVSLLPDWLTERLVDGLKSKNEIWTLVTEPLDARATIKLILDLSTLCSAEDEAKFLRAGLQIIAARATAERQMRRGPRQRGPYVHDPNVVYVCDPYEGF